MTGKNVVFAPPSAHPSPTDGHAQAVPAKAYGVATDVMRFRPTDAVKTRELGKSATRKATAKSAVRQTPATFDYANDLLATNAHDDWSSRNRLIAFQLRAADNLLAEPLVQVVHDGMQLYPDNLRRLARHQKTDDRLVQTFGPTILHYVETEYALGNFTVRKTLDALQAQLGRFYREPFSMVRRHLMTLPPVFTKLPLPGSREVNLAYNKINFLPASLFTSPLLRMVTVRDGLLELHAEPSHPAYSGPLLGRILLTGNPVAELFKALPSSLLPREARDVMDFTERFGLERLADRNKVIHTVDLEEIVETMAHARLHEARNPTLRLITAAGLVAPQIQHIEDVAFGTIKRSPGYASDLAQAAEGLTLEDDPGRR